MKDDKVYVEDEKFVYDNYTEPPAKGVKMFSFLTLSKNDSSEVLSGIWRTNATRKYEPLTGSIFLQKKKKVEPRQTIIVKKLIDLGLANELAFLPPVLKKPNALAINEEKKDKSKNITTSSASTSVASSATNKKNTDVAKADNDKSIAINDQNSPSKKTFFY